MNVTIRKAVVADAGALAALAGQLGYPVEIDRVRRGIRKAADDPDGTILVAADEDDKAIAWTSVGIVEHFYTATTAEISGFVVDAGRRGEGIGKKLMSGAEAWARGKGHSLLVLRANSIRKDAHRFYEKIGFLKKKEQFVYEKAIGQASP